MRDGASATAMESMRATASVHTAYLLKSGVACSLAELVEDAVHVLVDILELKLHVIVVLEVDFLIQSLHFASGIVVVVADYVGVLLEVYLRMDEVVEALLVE